MKLALRIAPQRSTQYTNMVRALALPELLASPLASALRAVTPLELAGQAYLQATFDETSPQASMLPPILARLGTISETYEYFEHIGDKEGPFLRPLTFPFTPFVPLEMAEARRYKGKTNEIFTRVLLNTALFGGAYAEKCTERLRILDPLAGGGTTLFLALAYGYDAFGIEVERQNVETTAVFVRQYLENEHISHKELVERGRKAGKRYQFEIGPKNDRHLFVLTHGNTYDALAHMREVVGGPRIHAIVGDLPYGIQHIGEISLLLSKSLPEWERLLLPGGTLALSWNATRVERAEVIRLIERYTQLQVHNEPPYTQFAHTVDRVIKQRDIVVAVRNS